jgi:myo-inositol-1(or 4)-monophosphatase
MRKAMSDFQATILPIIRKTRSMLMPSYGNVETVEYKSASSHDVVTKLDRAVETYLKAELNTLYPDIAFVGEEFGGDRNVGRKWLCDPIDGTGLFIRGLEGCTTMLALVENDRVNYSVIYDFVHDIVYHAERGKGAYADSTPIRVSTRPWNGSYFCYETRARTPDDVQRLIKLRDSTHLMKIMCAGYEHVLVATGKVEGRVNFDPWGNDYDYAAGSLLIEEAGGIVANLGVRTYDYRNYNYIAANPEAFNALTDGPDAIFPIT